MIEIIALKMMTWSINDEDLSLIPGWGWGWGWGNQPRVANHLACWLSKPVRVIVFIYIIFYFFYNF